MNGENNNKLSSSIKLAFKNAKEKCDHEYYKYFARKSFFYAILAMIGIFLAVTAWNFNYAHQNITEISEEQIRHEGRIKRNEEKHSEVIKKLDNIEKILNEIEKSL